LTGDERDLTLDWSRCDRLGDNAAGVGDLLLLGKYKYFRLCDRMIVIEDAAN